MTPREPDRYDKLAETLFSGAMYPSPGQIAAALRQAADEAIERAAQDFDAEAGRFERDARKLDADGQGAGAAAHFHCGRVAEENAKRIRALASPAAAPAAENTGMDFQPAPEQDSQKISADAQVEGARPAGCQTPLRGTASGLSPSLLPRVLAALEQDACAGNVSAHRLESLAAELRRYIAEREPAEKRIAELEAAIRWACGETDFVPPEGNPAKYWWRYELYRRSGLKALDEKPAP